MRPGEEGCYRLVGPVPLAVTIDCPHLGTSYFCFERRTPQLAHWHASAATPCTSLADRRPSTDHPPGAYENARSGRNGSPTTCPRYATFSPDGRFRTGDHGRITVGRLILVGGRKDSIIVNGVKLLSHDWRPCCTGCP